MANSPIHISNLCILYSVSLLIAISYTWSGYLPNFFLINHNVCGSLESSHVITYDTHMLLFMTQFQNMEYKWCPCVEFMLYEAWHKTRLYVFSFGFIWQIFHIPSMFVSPSLHVLSNNLCKYMYLMSAKNLWTLYEQCDIENVVFVKEASRVKSTP